MPNSNFARQVVVITGASAGIGRALALQLAEQGACLGLAARNAERLDALAQECRARGGEALAIPTDVSDEAQCRTLIDQTVAAYGQLDMLINNAGFAMVGMFAELPDLRLFQQVLNVNFYGAVYCTYYALPYLRQTRGRLVNISSLGGRMVLPHNSAYCSSKFALEGFSETLRIELGREISVTVICPSWVVTEFHEHYLDKDGHPKGASGRAIYTEKMMTADECARITLSAAWRRKRDVVMGRGRLALWLKLLAPAWLDWITLQAFLRSIVKRMDR